MKVITILTLLITLTQVIDISLNKIKKHKGFFGKETKLIELINVSKRSFYEKILKIMGLNYQDHNLYYDDFEKLSYYDFSKGLFFSKLFLLNNDESNKDKQKEQKLLEFNTKYAKIKSLVCFLAYELNNKLHFVEYKNMNVHEHLKFNFEKRNLKYIERQVEEFSLLKNVFVFYKHEESFTVSNLLSIENAHNIFHNDLQFISLFETTHVNDSKIMSLNQIEEFDLLPGKEIETSLFYKCTYGYKPYIIPQKDLNNPLTNKVMQSSKCLEYSKNFEQNLSDPFIRIKNLSKYLKYKVVDEEKDYKKIIFIGYNKITKKYGFDLINKHIELDTNQFINGVNHHKDTSQESEENIKDNKVEMEFKKSFTDYILFAKKQ